MSPILRGAVWMADLNPTRGREQAGKRPVLVISDDRLNQSRADLVIILPVTSTDRGIPSHVRVDPPEAGLKNISFILCEAVRSVSKDRLVHYLGAVAAHTLLGVEDRLRLLMRL